MKRPLKTGFFVSFTMILAVFIGIWVQSSAQATSLEPLSITNHDGKIYHFQIERAITREQKRVGLMFRESIADDYGMLFVYDTPQHATMWMKNTLIPLDMLFIDAHGTIRSIHHSAEPHSLTYIHSGHEVLAVLELKGGTAKQHYISEGGQVTHAIFTHP